MEDCAAYIPGSMGSASPTLLSGIRPSDLALNQPPTTPLSHILPATPFRLIPAPPALSTQEISSSNPYESIPYTKQEDKPVATHTYNRLTRSQLAPKQVESRGNTLQKRPREGEYDMVDLEEVSGRTIGDSGTNESYDDAI